VEDVFCHNCGHRNRGGQFLLVVRFRPPAESSEATITLQPVDDHGEAGEEESAVTLVEVPHGTGSWCQAWQSGQALPLADDITRPASPESDIFLDDITVSRATPNWSVDRRRSRDQRRGILEWHLRQPGAD